MSNTVAQQAKSGFKTFILTFGVSLLVFGAFYYIISDFSGESVSVEETNDVIGHTRVRDQLASDVQGVSDVQEEVLVPDESAKVVAVAKEETEVAVVTKENEEESDALSPFGALAAQEVNVESRVVLAGASPQTTQSTVPTTGVTNITVAFMVSIVLMAIFVYVIFVNPRRYALSNFEKKIVKD